MRGIIHLDLGLTHQNKIIVDKTIRILQVIGSMGAGGAETMLMNWYRGIDRAKVQFDFLVHHQAESCYEEEIRSLGGVIYHLSFADDHNIVKYKKDLKEFFQAHPEYKIVHGHHSSYGRWYLKAAKEAGVPVRISHSHIASFSRTIMGVTFFILSRGYKKNANVHFACSIAAGNYMYGKTPFEVINNGIDTERFKYNPQVRLEVRQKCVIKDTTTLFVHVGRFHHQKNHDFLIDIFNAYSNENPDCELWLVGEGPLQNKVKEKVAQLGLSEKVCFLNNRSDVPDLLSASDLFLFPSFYEGLPLTLVEAQTSGLPVVCSDSITDETKLTDNYFSLSLSAPLLQWVKTIIQACEIKIDRSKCHFKVKEVGYDSTDVAMKIQKYYIEHYGV